ncbi:ELM1/GtrOC1 family putative glycosyltransferase [uncultured Acinetobacter sp.]|uniref:mitochondrial fission ELM1 family protein n=1 Tax=uncultured Acinetobacter sp. TaxID=165433 RepID=UPI002636941B|nr:ELM1/GtrOC1 family putative glycosyltransferase [uncultured Acinetobacter sp.]
MHIVYVTDGKAGHRSQALGLYQAMQRLSQHAVSFEEVPAESLSRFNLFLARGHQKHLLIQQKPDYIFSVGSATQLKALLLGQVFPKAKTVVLMKPKFPLQWFDYVIVPQHDGLAEQDNVIVTQGALNPIVNEKHHQKKRILIALGGASKRHQWSDAKVLQAIEKIVQDNKKSEIVVTTSRRTPKDFLSSLHEKTFAKNLQIFPVEDTPQGWIFEQMQLAEAVWVTDDSISMLYEALSAGCKVGVIEIDRLKQDRITKSVDLLLQDRRVKVATRLSELYPATQFAEADRVVAQVVK